MRVYLPATLPMLAELRHTGELAPPRAGFAVTPTLREWYAEGDLEELEYVALTAAARASLRLLGADDTASRRRTVIVAELPDGGVRWAADRDRAGVDVRVPLRLSQVAAVHVDEAAAASIVAAAVAALSAARASDPDAAFTVAEADGFELQWWATQEIDELLAGQG